MFQILRAIFILLFQSDRLIPTHRCKSFGKIDFDYFEHVGWTKLIIDVDGTVAARKYMPTADTTRFIKGLIDRGFEICLLSNTGLKIGRILSNRQREQRIRAIAEAVGTSHWHCASYPNNKPSIQPFLIAQSKLAADPDQVVVIGDQVFSDILGGNDSGYRTILVDPLGKDHWITFWKRLLEWCFFRMSGLPKVF